MPSGPRLELTADELSRDTGEHRQEVVDWLTAEGVDANRVVALRVLGEGEGEVEIYSMALNDQGRPYSVDGRTAVLAQPFIIQSAVPPPFMRW